MLAALLPLLPPLLSAPPLEGKGAVVDVVRTVDAAALGAVRSVRVSGPVRLRVSADAPADACVIHSEPNLSAHVRTRVDGSVLVVDVDTELVSAAGIVVSAQLLQLQNVSVSGEAVVDAYVSAAGPVVIDAKGAARVTAVGAAPVVHVVAEGAVVVDAKGVITKDAAVVIKGAADVRVAPAATLLVEGGGVGVVHYRGAPLITQKTTGMVSVEPLP